MPSHATASPQSTQLPARGPGPTLPRLHYRLLAASLLFGWLPPFVAPRISTSALRAAGIQIGKGSIFWSLPTLVGNGAVHRNLRIGQLCGFNKGCYFDLEAPIVIGNHVAVGHDVAFLTSGPAHGALPKPAAAQAAAPIVVGDGVWLGARATVLPGVTIGMGSVVGAGVTVAQDVPANTLLSGARPVSIARWR